MRIQHFVPRHYSRKTIRSRVIAVGSHGCIKLLNERKYFINGLKYVIDKLKPQTIVVYGATPDEVFAQYKEAGIEILQFDSDFMQSRKAVGA